MSVHEGITIITSTVGTGKADRQFSHRVTLFPIPDTFIVSLNL